MKFYAKQSSSSDLTEFLKPGMLIWTTLVLNRVKEKVREKFDE